MDNQTAKGDHIPPLNWQDQVRKAAREYGDLGFPVFQVYSIGPDGRCTCNKDNCEKPGKHPRSMGWQGKATTNIAIIDPTWALKPDSNIGIPTGDKSGILVLDVDLAKDEGQQSGEESLAELIQTHGALPKTVEAITGSGGRHLYFQHPSYQLKGRCGIKPGLDIRADGNLIVVPPSRHVSGNTYMWKKGHGLGEIDIAPAPDWLLALIPKNSIDSAGNGNDWVQLAAEDVPEGERNNAVASMAGFLFASDLDPCVSCELLWVWNEARCSPPLDDHEVSTTIKSIAGRELRKLKGE